MLHHLIPVILSARTKLDCTIYIYIREITNFLVDFFFKMECY